MLTGKGVSQTNKEAAKWFQLATKQDNKLAQGELGMLPSKNGSVRED
jgi:TPR repeat protein